MGKSIIFYILILVVSACAATQKNDFLLYSDNHKKDSVESLNKVKRAFNLYEQRNVVPAMAVFKEIVKTGNKDSLMLFKYAFLLSKTGDKVGALKIYKYVSENIRKSYSNHKYASRVWINMGNLNFRNVQFQAALKCYKKGYESGDRSKAIYYALGMVYRRLEKYSLAAAHMEKADQTQFKVNFYLSAIYYELKKIDAALMKIKVALSINENDTRALGAKGNFLFMKAGTMEKKKNFPKMSNYLRQSAVCYKKAIANGGNLYSIHLKNVYAKLKKYRKLKSKDLPKIVK